MMRADLAKAIAAMRRASSSAIEAGSEHADCSRLIKKFKKAMDKVHLLFEEFPEGPPPDLYDSYKSIRMPDAECV